MTKYWPGILAGIPMGIILGLLASWMLDHVGQVIN